MMDFVDGDLIAIPNGSATGVPLLAGKFGGTGILIELAAGDSVTYVIRSAQPTAAPTPTITRSGAEIRRVDEPLGPNMMVYVTAKTGSPAFRAY